MEHQRVGRIIQLFADVVYDAVVIADVTFKLGRIRKRPEIAINRDILADAKKLRTKG
jgi:hypothetical protein